jgi:hypothetical protein
MQEPLDPNNFSLDTSGGTWLWVAAKSFVPPLLVITVGLAIFAAWSAGQSEAEAFKSAQACGATTASGLSCYTVSNGVIKNVSRVNSTVDLDIQLPEGLMQTYVTPLQPAGYLGIAKGAHVQVQLYKGKITEVATDVATLPTRDNPINSAEQYLFVAGFISVSGLIYLGFEIWWYRGALTSAQIRKLYSRRSTLL